MITTQQTKKEDIMTRKELIDNILKKVGDNFDWGFGRFEHWDTADCVEHIPSGTKFYFCNLIYVNKSAHYDSPFKKHNGKYDMSARDWTEKVSQFQTWIAMKQAASLLGHLGGSVKSERKTAAVRENGKKGGRPTMETKTWVVLNNENGAFFGTVKAKTWKKALTEAYDAFSPDRRFTLDVISEAEYREKERL
jgi:hypothetical protein